MVKDATNTTGRPRWVSDLCAAGVVYVPQLLPFAVGPLTGCGDCVRRFGIFFPVLPGFFLGMQLDGAGAFALMGLGTAVALVVVRVLVGSGWAGLWLAVLFGTIASAANALAVAAVMRA